MVTGAAPLRGATDDPPGPTPHPPPPRPRRPATAPGPVGSATSARLLAGLGGVVVWLAARPGLTAGTLVGSVTLALDVRTMLPGLGLWDTAEFQALGPVLGIAHPTGFPSYTLLAWFASVVLQPFGDPAFRANLLSAMLVAGATCMAAATIVGLTRRWLLGVVGGLALATAPFVWAVGQRADAHALHVFVVALLVWLLVQWQERTATMPARSDRWLLAAAVVFGISLGNHGLTLLLAPGIGLFLLIAAPRLLRERVWLVVRCAALMALTVAVLYAYLPIRSQMHPPLDYGRPDTLGGFLAVVFATQFHGSFQAVPSPASIPGDLVALLAGQLGVFGLLAIPGALVTLYLRPAVFALTASSFLITWSFAIAYDNADISRYYLVPLLMATLWAAVALEASWQTILRARSSPGSWLGPRRLPNILAPDPAASPPEAVPVRGRPSPTVTAIATVIAAAVLVLPSAIGVATNYERVDSSRETYGRAWTDMALDRFEPGAVVLSWWSYSTALWYAQFVEGRRPDVWVVDDRTRLDQGLGDVMTMVARELPRRPVYVVLLPEDLPEVQAAYDVRRVAGSPPWGPIYRVYAQGTAPPVIDPPQDPPGPGPPVS